MKLALLGLAALVCVALAFASIPSPATVTRGTPREARTTRSATSLPIGRPRYVTGAQRTYRVHARYALDLGSTAVELDIDGAWQLTVARVDTDGILLRGELLGTVTGTRADAAIATELGRPHYLSYEPSGKLLAVRARRDSDPVTFGILHALAADSQLVAGDGRWQAEESDPTGDYIASYARDGNRIEKDKLRYVRIANGRIESLDAHVTASIDDATWPETLDATQVIAITSTGGVHVTARSSLALRLENTADITVGAIELEGYETSTTAIHEHGRLDADRALVAGASLDDILGELTGADDHVRARVFAQLGAYVRLHPEAAETLARRVLATSDDPRAAMMIDALGGAAAPQAQRALATLLTSGSLPAAARARAAVATTMLDAPTPEITDALEDGMASSDAELKSTSSLALGAAAYHLGRDGQTVVDDLLERLAHATSVDDRMLLLQALGNTADPRVLPALQAALGDGDPRIREVACTSLRLIADSAVDTLLGETLDRDPDASVRRAAVFASSFRAPAPLLDALASGLRADSDAGVRLAIVQLLGDHRDIAGVIPLLRVALGDPSTDVRAAAQRLLDRG